MNVPQKIQNGDNFKYVTVNRINEIIDYLKANRLTVDDRTLIKNQGANGITLSAKIIDRPQTPMQADIDVQSDTCLAKVVGGNNINGYSVQLYANGRDNPSTGAGTMYATEIGLNTTIPTGTWLVVHKYSMMVFGGTNQL